ncbi:MAG: biotin transporter BioY [Firmicutes bacterium]|nr:biotin transporter BioY [Bacillota bacterium]
MAGTSVSKTKISVNEMAISALFAALTAVMGYVVIPLPFSPVPITGQTFAVMLTGGLLKTRTAVISMLVFIFIGILGLPVFAGGRSGMGVLLGPTGGYILSWPLAVMLISKLLGKKEPTRFVYTLFVNILGGIIIVYLIGILQLAIVTGLDFKRAFMLGGLPFIPGDIFKAFVSALLTVRLRKTVLKQ